MKRTQKTKLTERQLERIAESFAKKYLYPKPYSEYINSVGVGTKSGKDCLLVTTVKPLPRHLTIPKVFKGIKVCIEESGKIVPHQNEDALWEY